MALAYKDWSIADFSMGRVDAVDDNLLPDNAARDCQNFIALKTGILQQRKGQRRFNSIDLGGPVTGLHPYYYEDTRRVIVVVNGEAGYINGDGFFTSLKSGLSKVDISLFEDCVNYVVSFNGEDTPWKYNGTTISNLANAPVDGRFPVLHKEQLFVVPKSDPSMLKWSDPFAPEVWTPVNYWYVKDGDGDEITCLRKFAGELVVFKRRSIHSLRGTTIDDFRLDELESNTGCVGPLAVTQKGLTMYLVSDEGIHSFNGMSVQNLSRSIIPDLWNNINKEYIHKAVATTWNNLIWFALPEGESTYNNLILVFNPDTGSFWPWRGINASTLITFNNGTNLSLLSGDAIEGFINTQDIGTDDFGADIESFWVSKTFDFGNAAYLKKARRAFIVDYPNQENLVTLSISFDYGDFYNMQPTRADGLAREYRITQQKHWRYLSPRFYFKGTGGCEIRGLTIPWKVGRRAKVRGNVDG